ncbi:MAG: hypothetical protein MJE66_21525 [Proteobacteria bacterium]|nr:hypothetical protein [Pseudomonadota bacterium]
MAERPSRVRRALLGLVSGALLDLLDFATFGPVGVAWGAALGGLAGYGLATLQGLTPRVRWAWAVASGLYCAFPLTEWVPLASVVATLTAWLEPDAAPELPPDEADSGDRSDPPSRV